MPTRTEGFTLIELMTVVAIIGVLSIMAMPIYQNFIIKSQLTRAVGELSSYRSAVEASFNSNSGVANSDIGYIPSNITTGTSAVEIATINADDSGHLVVTMGGNAHPRVAGIIVRLERTAVGRWSCKIDNIGNLSGWQNQYLPTGCSL